MKYTLYYLNKINAPNPFACDDNTGFLGRITCNRCDMYLYLDDAGQQMFIRYQKDGIWYEETCGAYYSLGLMDLVMFVNSRMWDLHYSIDYYLNGKYEVKGDKWPYGI